jgi:uncharacterized membrane protein
MSVSQPPSDAPFGLQPNVAAGLAYLFTWLGGIIFLVGGGTNRFVKFSAAQSLTFWILYWVVDIALYIVHLWMLVPILWIIGMIVWLWTFITGFQGKEVRIPGVADIADNVFKSALS